MPAEHIPYGNLPQEVTDNLTPEQWHEALVAIVHEHTIVPETTEYINLKNGQIRQYEVGERADAPLLATHNLSGGRGQDSTQFHTSPPDAHGVP
jgi:hypothetical protein